MIQDVLKLERRQTHVQRHYDSVRQHHSVITLEQLMRIKAQVGDAIARPDSLLGKRRAYPFAALAEFAVSELPFSRNDPNFIGEQIHGAVETPYGCQGDKHWRIVLLSAQAGLLPSNSLRLGLHTSISKSLENAAIKAAEVGANTFQIFSASPRMWRASPPAPSACQLLRRARERYDLTPLVIHDNYLINLASCSEPLRVQSTAAFRGEIERALAIGAEYLVAHPGNCKGHSVEQGIYAVIRSLAEAAEGLDTKNLMVLLENTAGSGAALGSRFEELGVMRQFAAELTDLKIGFCIDTCHCLASGYDVSSAAGLKHTVAEMDRGLGMEKGRGINAT